MSGLVRCFWLAVPLLVMHTFLWAQLPIIRPVALPSGTSEGIVHGIAQDQQGYMWFIIDGSLHRYDGYTYTTLVHNPLDTNSIAPNVGEFLYTDRQGYLWFGSTWGLERLEPVTGKITHFRHHAATIVEDAQGMIWVGNHKGLFRLDPHTRKFTHYRHNPDDSTSLSNNEVRALYIDKNGTLWVGTGLAFGDKNNQEGGLNRFDFKTGTFIRYLHDPYNPHSLADNRVRAMFEDSQGNFWVGTAGDGLHQMNRKQGSFQRYSYDASHPEKLSRPPRKDLYNWAADHITFIEEDASGSLWIGTFEGGLNHFDPKTSLITHYPTLQDSISAVEDLNVFWSATVSREGVLWIGTWYGVFQIDPLRKNIPHVAIGSPVFSLCQDTTGVVWLGTDRGILQHNRAAQTQQWYAYDASNPSSLSDNVVNAIYSDHSGILWVGTEQGGLNRFDAKTGSFTRYQHHPQDTTSLSNSGVSFIYEDSQNGFWVGTYSGLNRMDRNTGTFENFFSHSHDSLHLRDKAYSYMTEDRSGNLWITIFRGALLKLNYRTGKVQHYLSNAFTTGLYFDSRGILWIATIRGLYHSNASLDSFYRFIDHSVGLVENTIINGILEDNQGELWVNSSLGLLRINKHRNQTAIFSLNRNVNGESVVANQGQYLKGKGGELLMGARRLKGYYAFFPEQFPPNLVAPQIVFNEFRLADQPVMPGSNSPLKQPLNRIKEIELKYQQNVFSFDFAGLHYSNPKENRHLFMLENLDNDWRIGGEEKRAYYYNVPPGKYIFRVKVANSDGVWAEKSVKILIYPPWWRTWWAYTFYGLCFVAIIFAAGIFQRRRLIEREREKARQRELEQAREIEKANKELALQKEELQSTLEHLKTTQTQLIAQEKAGLENELKLERLQKQQALASYQNKMSELEMMALRAQMNPHFIFNCLNSIDRFILKNESEAASDYLTKFSKLIRLILQNSTCKAIPLERELEALKLYIDMEMLRFEQRFSYNITIDPYLEIEEVQVPPLIIQPYVENAIWHGLMHKQEAGHLLIGLQLKGDRLYCQITDDGVGRKRASELKSKSASKNKSMGMQITSHRLELINALQEKATTVEVLDLMDASGEPCGTKVVLNIPV